MSIKRECLCCKKKIRKKKYYYFIQKQNFPEDLYYCSWECLKDKILRNMTKWQILKSLFKKREKTCTIYLS